jgi:DnaA family protein
MGSAVEADAARGLDATPERASLIVVDDVDRADASLQGRLFTLFNAVREAGGTFIATSRLPAARTALRDDLRTRLGWGVTLELRALTDGAKADALAAHAHGRGMHLSSEVIGWLLTHAPRDMPTLVAMLEALDRYSLARKRPLTLPLLREWMLSTGKNTSSL